MAKQAGGKATGAAGAEKGAADHLEAGIVALAEQLGRIVGTVQAKSDGWMDRETLSAQMAGVRDGATDLLKQLSGKMTGRLRKTAPVRKAPVRASKGRSGGVVDAPGKKHRKPPVTAAPKNLARSQAAKVRDAMPMNKTPRRRGRG